MLQQVQPLKETRTPVERTFVTHDGTELFYRVWPTASGAARGAIVLFHRGHEHGGRVAHLVDELDLPDFTFYAWDARGHGRSPGKRGYSPSFAHSVRDIDAFMKAQKALSPDGMIPDQGAATALRALQSVDDKMKGVKLDLKSVYTNEFVRKANAKYPKG